MPSARTDGSNLIILVGPLDIGEDLVIIGCEIIEDRAAP